MPWFVTLMSSNWKNGLN